MIMDISVVAHQLFRAEIRRLLFAIGLLVSLLVVSKCFTFPFEKTLYFLSAKKGSSGMMMANADGLNNLESTKIYAAEVVAGNDSSPFDLENEMDHEDTDYELESYRDNNSSNKVFFEKGVNVFTQANRIDDSYEKDIEPTTRSTGRTSNEASNLASTMFREGTRNLSVDSVTNVKEDTERQPGNKKNEVLRSNSEASTNSSLFKPKRWDKNPTTILQMNSLLLQSHLASRSMKPRWSSVRDRELQSAKLEIENASILRNSPELSASVFRNVSRFRR
ncbi:hypothetical protein PanWU01x14_139480 [Parasponia andersonii]|uniref:Uncharacterized protein n=1 Tax=Parasponia andersonii TaxID=3476 RepID=A0A2P5CMH4_PARAD|nr:hypothetical protein PanWU01x14_139480 [Parasponia andersonii]